MENFPRPGYCRVCPIPEKFSLVAGDAGGNARVTPDFVMLRRFLFKACLGAALLALNFAWAPTAQARSERWKDLQGNSFRGEPVEAVGPFALFRHGLAGRRVLLDALAPEDCVRFYEEAAKLPSRAADWAEAKSDLSWELRGRVTRVEGDRLVPVDVKGRPEPEFYVLFFVSNGEGKSWDLLGKSASPYAELQQKHPGWAEGVMFGLRHTATEHSNMAVSMKVPWLVASFYDESKMNTLVRLAPAEGFALQVLTREGVPVFAESNPDEPAIKRFFGALDELLALMNPDNPRTWKARAHYLRAIQPAIHANGHSDPVLLGNPLVAEGLRQRKIFRIDATLRVAADGAVEDVTVSPNDSIPPEMMAPLGEALHKSCVFVPAVDHGKFVAGVYQYHLDVPQ